MSTTQNNAQPSSHTELSHPYELALVPSALLADDAPSQNTALQAVTYAPDSDSDEESRFDSQIPKTRSLKLFQRLYNSNNRQLAIDLLSKRMKIDFRSDDLLTSVDANNVAWDLNEHFLDFMVCVGEGLGLGPIIPNQEVNSLYQVSLDFGERYRVFHARYAKLGFCAKHSMLWIGKTPASEDIWIAWVPKNGGDEDEDDKDSSTTVLSQRHYRLTVILFAKMLTKIGYRDITVMDEYPDLTNDDDFMFASNIM